MLANSNRDTETVKLQEAIVYGKSMSGSPFHAFDTITVFVVTVSL